jgi:hypothetical protein
LFVSAVDEVDVGVVAVVGGGGGGGAGVVLLLILTKSMLFSLSCFNTCTHRE